LTRTYNALTGYEALKVWSEILTKHLAGVPGMSSRLVTFPRVRITSTIRVECFDREPVEVTNVDELVEELVKDNLDSLFKVQDTSTTFEMDETKQSADSLRQTGGLAVTRPKLMEGGQIVDVPDPLPAGENLSNIVQFGMPGATLQDGTVYSGKGLVIEQESVGLTGANPVGPKLMGTEQRHFRVRRPGE
jgi:hypothetical protein